MEGLTIEANKRDILGKKTRFLRRQNVTPAHLFGHGLESLALQCDTAKLQRLIARAGTTRLIDLAIEGDKKPRSVFLKEIQKDAISGELLHVDFYEVKKTEKVKVEVPIILVGEAPGIKAKGCILTHALTTLSIECLPAKIPPKIEVDLSPLTEIGQAIYVRDIVLDPDIIVHTDPDQMVARVAEARVEKVEEVAAPVEAEAVAEAPAEGAEAEEKPEEEPTA